MKWDPISVAYLIFIFLYERSLETLCVILHNFNNWLLMDLSINSDCSDWEDVEA